MQPKHFFLICLLLAFVLSACGQPEAGATSGQFVDDRAGPRPRAQTNQGATMMGVIETVDGRALQLNRPMLGETITVQLAPDAKILMQADVQPGEIQHGDQVALLGQQQGDVYLADFVQIGTGGALSGGPLIVSAPATSDGMTDQVVTNTGKRIMDDGLSGMVEQVDGTKLVVKSDNGKTTRVQLTEHVSLRKQKQFGLEALEPGKFVIASGAQKGGSFEVAEMEVLPPPSAP